MRPLSSLVIASALALSCSSAPPGPRGASPPGLAARPTAAEGAPAVGRVYADLGPAHLVPQLGTDGSTFAVSPDGLLGVIGGGGTDLTVQVWDLDRRVVVAELAPPPSLVNGKLGFARGGAFIVLQSTGRTAVWDGATGALVGAFEGPGWTAVFDHERADPEALFYDEKAKAVVLRTLRAGPELFRLPVATAPGSLTISGERYLVSTGQGIEVRDRTGKLLQTLPPNADKTRDGSPVAGSPWQAPEPTHPPESLNLDPTSDCQSGGTKLVCGVYAQGVTRFYVADLGAPEPSADPLPVRPAARFEVPESGLGVIIGCSDGQYGASGFPAGSKDLADAQRVAEVKSAATRELPQAKLLATRSAIFAAGNGHVVGWDVASGKRGPDFASQDLSWSSPIAASPDGKTIAVGGVGGAGHVVVLDAVTGAVLRTVDHGHDIRQVHWSPDGTVLVTTAHRPIGPDYLRDDEASIKLWSASTGKLHRTIPGLYEATYSENGALFVATAYDEARVLDARTVKTATRVSGAVMFAIPSPDGRWILTPVTDTQAAHPGLYEHSGLAVRSATTGAVARRFDERPGEIRWSPDSARLLLSTARSWGEDSSARSFDLWLYAISTGKAERRWTGPGAVQEAWFALGGRLVVTAMRGMLRVSRVSDGASLWIQPVTAGGKCSAVAFDEAGHFDGADAALAAVGFRLGDDLRKSALVHAGPRVDPLRSAGLHAAFIAAAR